MATLDLKRIPATLSDGTAYDISYWHIESGNPGPCVLVTAAIHGNEVNGTEAIRRFMPYAKEHLAKGSCLLVPFANPQAVSGCRPHIDFEFGKSHARDQANNANCTWPGNAEGSSGQRLIGACPRISAGKLRGRGT